eukprot:m.141437 g.141437  ORF g.141437 m.141437 type:complete len:346 (+) comp52600_c0_seq6:271-1308(+)
MSVPPVKRLPAAATSTLDIVAPTPFHCIGYGLRDACNIIQPIKTLMGSPEVANEAKTCLLVNGVIFLGSQILFHSVVRPAVVMFLRTQFSYDDTHAGADSAFSGVDFVLDVVYNLFWVYPFYLGSKVFNSLVYQDIANGAYEFLRGKRQRQPRVHDLYMYLIVSIADVVKTTLLELLLLAQAWALMFIPTIGPIFSFVYTSWLCSLWCFEYAWVSEGIFGLVSLSPSPLLLCSLLLLSSLLSSLLTVVGEGWDLKRRIEYFENKWAYFLGFGMPFTIVTSYFSFMISSAVFALAFPWFIITAVAAKPASFGSSFVGLVPGSIPLFAQSHGLTNYLLSLAKAHRTN